MLGEIEGLKGTIGEVVGGRIAEFKENGRKPLDGIFKELCFCLCTANNSAERGLRALDEIGDGFCSLPEPELRKKMREIVCRFYNNKTEFVLEARGKMDSLDGILSMDGISAREWLVENIKGLGFKEASHFLRNIGFEDVAIIDFHIIDLLVREGLIKKPKSLTKKRYLEIEQVLDEIAKRLDINLAELDLYLWYMETGKVLK